MFFFTPTSLRMFKIISFKGNLGVWRLRVTLQRNTSYEHTCWSIIRSTRNGWEKSWSSHWFGNTLTTRPTGSIFHPQSRVSQNRSIHIQHLESLAVTVAMLQNSAVNLVIYKTWVFLKLNRFQYTNDSLYRITNIRRMSKRNWLQLFLTQSWTIYIGVGQFGCFVTIC